MLRTTERGQPVSLRRLLVNIAILLILPLVIGGVAYRSAFRALEEGAKKLHEAVLLRATDRWSDDVADIRSLVGVLATNATIRRFSSYEDPYSGNQIYRVVEAVDELGSLLVSEELVRDLYVVYPSNGVVVSRETAYRLNRFYPDHLSEPRVSRDAWLASLAQAPAPYAISPVRTLRFFGDQSEDILTVVAPVQSANENVYIVILVRASRIRDMVSGIDLSSGGWAALLGSDGSALMVAGDTDAFDTSAASLDLHGVSQTVVAGAALQTRASTPSGDWLFIAHVSLSSITRDLRSIWRTTGYLLAAILAAGAVLSVFLGVRLVRPVRFLSQDRERLAEAVKAQVPLLTAGFIERLLRGDFASDSEIDQHRALTDLDLSGSWFVVVSCHIAADSIEPMSAGDSTRTSRLIVAEAIQRTADDLPVHLHSMTTDTLTLLVVGYSADMRGARTVTERIIARAMEFVPHDIRALCSWGAGLPRARLIDVSNSYRESTIALEYQEIRHESSLVFYDDIPRREPGYEYPVEVENRLVSIARSGRTDELESLLAELHRENMEGRHPESLSCRLFADDLLCTAMKVLQLNVLKDDEERHKVIARIQSATEEPPHARYEAAADLLRHLSSLCEAQKKSHNADLSRKLVTFVEQHFNDPNLTRSSVAAAFSLSEAYVSQFFKEQAGATLGTYIQDLRLREARRLLASDEYTVKQVGERVGYATYPTFARAFKKAFGVSASEFRAQSRNTAI